MKCTYNWICNQLWLINAIFQGVALQNKEFIIPKQAAGFLRLPSTLLTYRFGMFLEWWGYQMVTAYVLEMMPRRMNFVHWDGKNWQDMKNTEWKESQNLYFFFSKIAA
jgi:hypothetical protein